MLVVEYTRIHDYEGLHASAYESALTNTLMYLMGVIGMPVITAENCDEFYKRLKVYDACTNNIEALILHDDIVRRIGLTTNWSSMTTHAFTKQVAKWIKQN